MEQSAHETISSEVERAYQVLGVAPGVSRAQLNVVYLDLVKRYDPKKLADLGGEFTVLSVVRLAEATAAFEILLGAVDVTV